MFPFTNIPLNSACQNFKKCIFFLVLEKSVNVLEMFLNIFIKMEPCYCTSNTVIDPHCVRVKKTCPMTYLIYFYLFMTYIYFYIFIYLFIFIYYFIFLYIYYTVLPRMLAHGLECEF